MTEQEKSKKVMQAEEAVRQAKARLAKARREERKSLEKERSHHKYMMGGLIAKYFEECFDFSEKEMNRIIAYAIKHSDTRKMIDAVVRERPAKEKNNAESQENNNANGENGQG